MSNHHNGLMKFLAGHFQKTQYIAAGSAVKVSSRFVGQDDSRFRNKGAGNRYTLLLTTGQIVRHTVQLFIESQHFHDFIHEMLINGITIQLHRQNNIFIDVQHRNKIVILKDKTDVASAEDGKLFILEFRQFFSFYFDTAGSWSIQTSHHIQKCGFSTARSTNNSHELPILNGEGYAIQCFRNIGL